MRDKRAEKLAGKASREDKKETKKCKGDPKTHPDEPAVDEEAVVTVSAAQPSPPAADPPLVDPVADSSGPGKSDGKGDAQGNDPAGGGGAGGRGHDDQGDNGHDKKDGKHGP